MNWKFARRLDLPRLLTAAGTIALVVMLFGSITDVVLRLFFKHPLAGTIDLVEVTVALVAFLALPECFRHDEQIKVDVLDTSVGPRGVAILRLFGEIATLAFLVLLAVTLVVPLADAYRFGDRKADLPVPIFLLLLAIEISLVVSVVVVAGRVVTQVRGRLVPDLRPVTASDAPPSGGRSS
jgi:TRAP-type C4-dicarboxylate transport system permease small subunit